MKATFTILLVVVGAGCANIPDQSAEPRANKEYVTGSALPARHGTAGPTAVVDRETAEREMQIRVQSVKGQ